MWAVADAERWTGDSSEQVAPAFSTPSDALVGSKQCQPGLEQSFYVDALRPRDGKGYPAMSGVLLRRSRLGDRNVGGGDMRETLPDAVVDGASVAEPRMGSEVFRPGRGAVSPGAVFKGPRNAVRRSGITPPS